jgi:hypothetical protein
MSLLLEEFWLKLHKSERRENMKNRMSRTKGFSEITELIAMICLIIIIIAIPFLCARGCNHYFNNQNISKKLYHLVSEPYGLNRGHIEYIRYADGSQDVKIYGNFRDSKSSFYQDLDGDGRVDRIRINSSRFKANRLSGLFIREQDYETHKEEFDKADRKLQELINKYPELEKK